MAGIFTYGLVLVIGLSLGLMFTVVGLFFGHIILFDIIFFSVIFGIICNQILGVHTALCLLIGLTLLDVYKRQIICSDAAGGIKHFYAQPPHYPGINKPPCSTNTIPLIVPSKLTKCYR